MSRTLLAIQSYPAAWDRVQMLWATYAITGWPILGFDCEDGRHPWPAGVPHMAIGQARPWPMPGVAKQPYDDNLCRKFIRTMRAVFYDPRFSDVTDMCIVEADGLFLQRPPAHPGGFVAHFCGYCPPEWKSGDGMFCHCPWWMDRETAKVLIRVGDKMIAEKNIGNGSPDVFVGKLIKEAEVKFTASRTWSCNGGGLHNPDSNMAAALKAVKEGVWFVHGLRTKEEMEELLKARPE